MSRSRPAGSPALSRAKPGRAGQGRQRYAAYSGHLAAAPSPHPLTTSYVTATVALRRHSNAAQSTYRIAACLPASAINSSHHAANFTDINTDKSSNTSIILFHMSIDTLHVVNS